MTFSVKRFKPFHPFVVFDNEVIDEVTQHTHLGVTLASNLSWKPHIFYVYERACKRVNMLKGLKFKLSRNILERLYKSLVRPVMEYADVVWDGCTESECDLLEHVQYEAAKIVTGAIKGTSKHRLALELGWEEMRLRRAVHKVILYYKIVNNLCPNYLINLLSVQVSVRTSYSLRNLKNFTLFASRTERFNKSFFSSTTRLWNNISIDVRSIPSLRVFKKSLLSYFSFPVKNSLYGVALDRFSSIIHTRLRLDACALNYYLFKIGRKESPACFCGFNLESVKHFFLKCPLFAASRHKLLSSAAQIFADR